jgi:hypothetical protein
MMIKRRMNDTTRKNAPRSSVIMMTHSLCWLGRQAFLLVPRPACMIDPQRPEFAPITMPTDAVKISINLPNMMEEFYPDSHHYIVAGRLRICNISTSCWPELHRFRGERCFLVGFDSRGRARITLLMMTTYPLKEQD